MNVLEVEELSVAFDKTPALWNINLSIPQGKLVGVVGPNGAGKSTFLKALLGLVKPLSGEIRFFGKRLKDVRAQIAYVPQRQSVDWNFPISVLDLVLMGRYKKMGFFKWPSAADREAALEMLDRVGMASFAKRQIDELSGGQQQRLFIARALLQEADLYLMDEPFAGVDMGSEQEILSILKELQKEGKTVLIVHHDLSTVEHYLDWAVMLNTSLVACGPIDEVFHQKNIFRTYGKTCTLLEEATSLIPKG